MQLRTISIACAIAGLACGAPEMAAAAPAMAAHDCDGSQAVPVDEPSRRQAATAVLCLVNRERAARGRRALTESTLLGGAARRHSVDMVANKFFSHVGSNGSSFRLRVARTGYLRGAASATVGETLAWGSGFYASPAQIVSSFLQSAQHRRTLLDKRFRDVGIGLVLGSPEYGIDDAATATLDFGRR